MNLSRIESIARKSIVYSLGGVFLLLVAQWYTYKPSLDSATKNARDLWISKAPEYRETALKYFEVCDKGQKLIEVNGQKMPEIKDPVVTIAECEKQSQQQLGRDLSSDWQALASIRNAKESDAIEALPIPLRLVLKQII